MKPEKFIFKYEGDLEYIDFDTLYVSQLHFTEFIKEFKDTIYPDGELKIKVKSLPPGSFPIELFLDVVQSKEATLWNLNSVLGVIGLVAAINSIFDLIKNFKGIKPDRQIEKDGVITFYFDNVEFQINQSIYNALKSNPKITYELSKSFDKINEDNDVVGIKILNEESQELMSISKEEFKFFNKENINSFNENVIEPNKIIQKENQVLSIFKVVFSKGFKWQFIYEGIKIHAIIEDNEFLLEVTRGELAFKNGDAIMCLLEIEQEYIEIANAYQNCKYKIVKVIQLLPRAEQSKLL